MRTEEILADYLNEIFNQEIEIKPLEDKLKNQLPLYMRTGYRYTYANLLNRPVVFVEPKNQEDFKILQTKKQLQKLPKEFGMAILLLKGVAAYNRNRLVQAGVNFVVPAKQLFLPDLLMDLRENYPVIMKKKQHQLLPSAQVIVLYHVSNHSIDFEIENKSFKEIAFKFNYSATTITKAIENLKDLDLISIIGEKEKCIRFKLTRGKLWHFSLEQNLFINPVLKQVFTNARPKDAKLRANLTALTRYTEINESRQQFYALDKNKYYELVKQDEIKEIEDPEAEFCIEIWKYDPRLLFHNFDIGVWSVDPLSLYLTFMDNKDERIEMELEDMLKQYIW
ncbi:hypothetical protein ABIB62_004424 [Mucilaginibacter sp. UYP25]|uniref:hypothetical protein n=1 Tax=unclassified Mucilaginibacter TaxID=2617802 RepID=UPI0033993397